MLAGFSIENGGRSESEGKGETINTEDTENGKEREHGDFWTRRVFVPRAEFELSDW